MSGNEETTRKQPEKIRNRILGLLKSNTIISRSGMANQLGIPEGSLRHHSEKMKNENLIRYEGSDKGGK